MVVKLPSFADPPVWFTARCPSTTACWLTRAILLARNARFSPWQTPFWQTSMIVHRLPSSHGAPSASTGLLQPPLGLQTSLVQELPSLQSSGVPGLQPVNGSQVSSPLQTSPSSHISGMPPVQTPAWQVPFVVQRSPQGVLFGRKPSAGHGAPPPGQVSATSHALATARQTVPAARGGWVHTPEPLQTSSVQVFPSSPQGTSGVDSHALSVSLHVV